MIVIKTWSKLFIVVCVCVCVCVYLFVYMYFPYGIHPIIRNHNSYIHTITALMMAEIRAIVASH